MTDPKTVTAKDIAQPMLVRHEGVRTRAYRDTRGILTIGVGRNIENPGISEDEALYLLNNDINNTYEWLSKYPWFLKMTQRRQAALIDFGFIGQEKFMTFKIFIQCLSQGDWNGAADALLNSAYAIQTGQRARDLSDLIRIG